MIRYAGQIAMYAVFAATVGLFSVWPGYSMLRDDEAIISLTFSHAAKRVGECRSLSQEELNELPPNMRKPNACPRERHPTYVELRANGNVVFAATLLPSGLWSDGKANVYYRARLKSGKYELFVGMNDSGDSRKFDYTLTQETEIEPGQNLVVSFDGSRGSFVIE